MIIAVVLAKHSVMDHLSQTEPERARALANLMVYLGLATLMTRHSHAWVIQFLKCDSNAELCTEGHCLVGL